MTVGLHRDYNVDNRWTTWIIKWKSTILGLLVSVVALAIDSGSGILVGCTLAASSRVHPWDPILPAVIVMARCSSGT